jgi:N-methylhydantoinase B
MDRGTRSDAFLLEILQNAFETIADNLAATIMRSAYSEILRESFDFSTALCDRRGRTLAQGVCTPMHLGAFGDAMEHLIAASGPAIAPGDVFLFNDPFLASGQHLPDIHVVKPIFFQGRIEAWATTLAHHSDVGGIVPGSNALGAEEVFQEGLRLPFLKLYAADEPNATLFQLIAANVRTPHLVIGDLEAQVAACRLGEREFLELLSRYGADTLEACALDLHDYAETLARREIEAIPDGVYRFTDHIDGLGEDPSPIVFQVAVSVAGDEVVVDWEGTEAQVKGGLNCTFPFTKSCAYAAVRSVFRDQVPNCAGFSRPIHVRAPLGTLVNPRFPAPTGARGITGYRMIDCLFGALSQAVPYRVAACGSGGSTLPTFSGWDGGRPFVFCETLMGTSGASRQYDGQEGIPHIGANQANVPVELIEQNYPLRIERYGFLPDTGGAGRRRGGLALRRDYRILCDGALLNMRSDKRLFPPHGLFGGGAGAPPQVAIIRDGRSISVPLLPLKPIPLQKDDLVVVQMPGGGGFGSPSERERALVLRDLREERISRETARTVYGMAMDESTRG